MGESRNVFGISKKLFYKLTDEAGFGPNTTDFAGFSQCFVEVLDDYILVPKTDVIE